MRSEVSESFALLEIEPGMVVLGRGPFRRHAELPTADVTAFYVDDFSLASPEPWLVPSKVEVLTPDTPWPFPHGGIEVAWSEPDAESFRRVFSEVSQALGSDGAGGALKMVPVLPQKGVLLTGEPTAFLGGLEQGRDLQWRYGFVEGSSGFCGVTPELLLQVEGHRLETMAVAGTAARGEEESFADDQKEIREHEMVVSFLQQELEALGRVGREPRGVVRVGGVTHFRSRIGVDLSARLGMGELVRLLHPTPAVGCLPRRGRLIAVLGGMRERVGCPAAFGAPFGLMHAGRFHCVIAIRGLFWEGDRIDLPAGCGLIAESRVEREWAEMALKREAVREIFGLRSTDHE